jgi:hypothetical protein
LMGCTMGAAPNDRINQQIQYHVAEGEELGSNLLHAVRSSRGCSVGSGRDLSGPAGAKVKGPAGATETAWMP